MITKYQAMTCHQFEHVRYKNMDREKSPVRCRANGKCKTWKREPEKFQLPVKYGMRDCFYIEPRNAADWVAVDGDEDTVPNRPLAQLLYKKYQEAFCAGDVDMAAMTACVLADFLEESDLPSALWRARSCVLAAQPQQPVQRLEGCNEVDPPPPEEEAIHA